MSSYKGRKHQNIYKLQIHLVPVNGRTAKTLFSSGDTSPRKFLHLTESQTTIHDLADEVSARFAKLYPDYSVPEIIRIQDNHGCDLDLDYSVDQVFDNSKQVRILISSFVPYPNSQQSIPQYNMSVSEQLRNDHSEGQSPTLPPAVSSMSHRKRNYSEIDTAVRSADQWRETKSDSINSEARTFELIPGPSRIDSGRKQTNTSVPKSSESQPGIAYHKIRNTTSHEVGLRSARKMDNSNADLPAIELDSRRHSATEVRPFNLLGSGVQEAIGPVVLNGGNDSELSEESSNDEGFSSGNIIAESPSVSKSQQSSRSGSAKPSQDDDPEDTERQSDSRDDSASASDSASSVVQKSNDSNNESNDDQTRLKNRIRSTSASTASAESSIVSSSVSFQAPDPLAVIHPTPPLSPAISQKSISSNQSNISNLAHPADTQESVSLPQKSGLSTPVSGILTKRQKASPFRTLSDLARYGAPDFYPSSRLKTPVLAQSNGLGRFDQTNESSSSEEEDSESSGSEEIKSKIPPMRRAGRKTEKDKKINGMAALLKHCGDTDGTN